MELILKQLGKPDIAAELTSTDRETLQAALNVILAILKHQE